MEAGSEGAKEIRTRAVYNMAMILKGSGVNPGAII
jgi:hypothetical protein